MIVESQDFAYVLACADPKIRRALTEYLDQHFGGSEHYFWIPELGGVKDLISPQKGAYRDHILQKIRDAQKVHPFGLIILVNHSICGAYKLGGMSFDDSAKEEAFHTEELNRAEGVLKNEFPELVVERHYFLKDEQRLAW